MKDNKNVKIKVKIELLSPVQLASGKANIVIDSDAVHDEYGVPYFPAKRFKGLLYESAVEIMEMGELCGNEKIISKEAIEDLFGKNEDSKEEMFIHDFVLPRYDEMRKAWEYLNGQFPGIIDKDSVLKEYTSIRYQTKIDDKTGIADEGSLRNMRVVNEGLAFEGTIELSGSIEDNHIQAVILALGNLKYAGSKRNRGFGQIKCTVSEIDGNNAIPEKYRLDKILENI